MSSWQPDPALPADQLPLFGDLLRAMHRGAVRQLAYAVALFLVAAVFVVRGDQAVPESVLLAYFFGGNVALKAAAVARQRRIKPLLAGAFERVEVSDVVIGRAVGFALPDGRWVRFRAPRHGAEVLAQRREAWLLHSGNRAAVLVPATDAGLVPARIGDRPPGRRARPAEPATTPDAAPLQALRKRREWTDLAGMAVISALYVVAWLTFPATDRLLAPLTAVLGMLTVLSTAIAAVASIRPSRAREWTELELEPVITFRRDRLSLQARATRPDGTEVALEVPRVSLAAALDIAATGKLWVTGSRAGLPGQVWTGTVRFQDPVGPLPDHDHA
ncbi:hypothetical protein [Amycolatopsis sp. DSM 110486]|uniref:hypothetical protein n=1 Tax=Amycolatopsis sp. DSM 110486 TaxID=2865832 RepID=UPI001C695601|nr:hypothetical protein [Amycolatopsis sp. DSM 110486]QYN24317.1 hypothetical protein K1T34_18855 [Amycolatopsis sp. DSM 110486]